MKRRSQSFRVGALSAVFAMLMSAFAPTVMAADKVFFYHTDPVGTPLSMTDSTGQKVWQADNKPFGEEYNASGTETNDRTFVGKEKDDETGLHYFGARYHDSKIGRFISPDPFGAVDPFSGETNYSLLANPQRLNYYAYSLNNPYRYVDSDGEFAVIAVLLFSALVTNMLLPSTTGETGVNSQTTAEFIGGVGMIETFGFLGGKIISGIGAKSTGSALPLSSLSGEIITREFATTKGTIEMAAEIAIKGKQLHLKDIAIYPKGEKILNMGTKAMVALKDVLAKEAKELGFSELRITGTRLSGANPGKVVDITIDLTKL